MLLARYLHDHLHGSATVRATEIPGLTLTHALTIHILIELSYRKYYNVYEHISESTLGGM